MVLNFHFTLQKPKNLTGIELKKVERETGLEPATFSLEG